MIVLTLVSIIGLALPSSVMTQRKIAKGSKKNPSSPYTLAKAYSAYASASIYGYKFGIDDSTYVDTSKWDHGNPLSWQSLVECFPDQRWDWSEGDNPTNTADNYQNWACDATFGDLWKDGSMLPCGKDQFNLVYYFLQDIEGTQMGPDGTRFISCYFSDESYGSQRNLQFPEGYFAVSVIYCVLLITD